MTHNKATSDFASLQDQQFINLISFRRNGQPVTTPVWFAQEGEKLYVFTGESTGKIKRIHNNPAVQVGPSNRIGKPLGPVIDAQAQIIAGSEAQRADALITAKYGWQKKLIGFLSRIRRSTDETVFLAITPTPKQQQD